MTANRLLSMGATELLSCSPMGLKAAILASEGRTIMAEVVADERTQFLDGVTNAEIVRAAGADLILLNTLDVLNPAIAGVPSDIACDPVSWLRRACGRPIGCNLEPVDPNAELNTVRNEIPIGRRVSPRTCERADELGLDFICLTGNPGTGVSNRAIGESIRLVREHYSGLIIAGKMHGAGLDEPVMDVGIARSLIERGIDMLLVPAPYTVPRFGEGDLREIVDFVREHNRGRPIEEKVLVLSANGTSQDGADAQTIRQIALASKASGADVQHIGDSVSGLAPTENIWAMGVAIRGIRHQLIMTSRSNIR